jgi:hypothetical protein
MGLDCRLKDVCGYEELRQQLEASQVETERLRNAYNDLKNPLNDAIKENTKLAEENFTMHELCKEYASEVKELKKLSEERRVALIGFDEDGTFCSSCGYDARIHSNHEPSCNYVRLCKKEE